MIKVRTVAPRIILVLLAALPAHAKKPATPVPRPVHRIVLPPITLNCTRPPSALLEQGLPISDTDAALSSSEIAVFRGDFNKIDRTVKQALSNGASFTGCMNALIDRTCQMSPWATLDVPQRATALQKVAQKLKTPYSAHGLNSERLIPCLAMRESVIEPASTYEGNCWGNDVNSRGLFHIELPTLEDLTSDYFGFVAQDYPREKLSSEDYAKFLHNQIDTDIKLQIEIMHATFKRKQAVYDWEYEKKHKRKPKSEASLRELLERYNGSGNKKAYASAVIQCMSCLKLKKETIGACLAKAHPDDKLVLTKWNRCKRNADKLALGGSE